mmetsp:Transcript_12056/g.24446  ORF Transcript_12056/g.24446 Transcript_12056/m.24446 type:complete len:177 (+) Transcript_12056:139-669(+)
MGDPNDIGRTVRCGILGFLICFVMPAYLCDTCCCCCCCCCPDEATDKDKSNNERQSKEDDKICQNHHDELNKHQSNGVDEDEQEDQEDYFAYYKRDAQSAVGRRSDYDEFPSPCTIPRDYDHHDDDSNKDDYKIRSNSPVEGGKELSSTSSKNSRRCTGMEPVGILKRSDSSTLSG